MRTSIIGYGHVGRAMQRLFPDALVYDKFIDDFRYRPSLAGSVAFVCVPTDPRDDGSADISQVEDAILSTDAEVYCIKSTVPPGTTDALRLKLGERIVCSPEYEGETSWSVAAKDWPFVLVGGKPQDCAVVIELLKPVLGPGRVYRKSNATDVELAKYMENAALAMYVTFANEMHNIASAVGADYDETREMWSLDERMHKSHTLVFEEARGYDGKCLPKDIAAIVRASQESGYDPEFLQAVVASNARIRDEQLAGGTR